MTTGSDQDTQLIVKLAQKQIRRLPTSSATIGRDVAAERHRVDPESLADRLDRDVWALNQALRELDISLV